MDALHIAFAVATLALLALVAVQRVMLLGAKALMREADIRIIRLENRVCELVADARRRENQPLAWRVTLP